MSQENGAIYLTPYIYIVKSQTDFTSYIHFLMKNVSSLENECDFLRKCNNLHNESYSENDFMFLSN